MRHQDINKQIPFLQVENPELPKVEIEIPSQLKLKLEDDCYFIKRKKKVGELNVSIQYLINFVLLVFPWFQFHVKVVLNIKFGLREQLFLLVVCCSI